MVKLSVGKNVFFVITKINTDEEGLIKIIDNEEVIKRISLCKSKKRRLEILNSHYIIYKTLGKKYFYVYDQENKPFIPNVGKISISHTDNYIAVMFGYDKSVGIDIEENDRDFTRAAIKFLNEKEKEWAKTNDYFRALWCGKEATFKFISSPKYSFSKYYIANPFDLYKNNFFIINVLEPLQTVKLSFLNYDDYFLTWCFEDTN